MSTMITEVYDALIAAGAGETKARNAAETLANYEGRFSNIEKRLFLLQWMVGFNLAISVAILFKLFS